MIQVLDPLTVDQIAAGEVIERPLSVVKELVENSIDAGADAITIEIRGGGIESIRVTDNGCGIVPDEIQTAFMRHATSKIRTSADLLTVSSLGFRGEALSSIAAVTKTEVITRTRESIVGSRYIIEGGKEIKLEEIGSPEGTTFIIRDLFYNTPVRREFLKSRTTEANAIQECICEFSLSHPEIRFQLIVDGKPKIKTTGDSTLRTSIYYNFGSELTNKLVSVDEEEQEMHLSGFIAKPEYSRGTRSYMHYFVNGRYIKNNIIQAAISDGYRDYLMNHRFPFTALMLELPPEELDVNVHPTKREVRFRKEKAVYELIFHAVKQALDSITLIPEETLGPSIPDSRKPASTPMEVKAPEPFEKERATHEYKQQIFKTEPMVRESSGRFSKPDTTDFSSHQDLVEEASPAAVQATDQPEMSSPAMPDSLSAEENAFLQENVFREEEAPEFRILGQVFDTYWLVEYRDELLIIDQHAAHEKILYERFVSEMKAKSGHSQKLLAPLVVTLSGREWECLDEYREAFTELGFGLEDFGDTEILIQAVPADFLNLDSREVFIDILDSLMTGQKGKKPEMILDRLATIACKAAVKGNNTLSTAEAATLIRDMLSLEEPYHCPHGRPTTIAMSKSEFEKKFKRIL